MQTANLKNRDDRAHALLLGGAVREMTPSVYEVTGSKPYTVITLSATTTCTCPDHEYRQVICKHIRAVELYQASTHQMHTVREMVVA